MWKIDRNWDNYTAIDFFRIWQNKKHICELKTKAKLFRPHAFEKIGSSTQTLYYTGYFK